MRAAAAGTVWYSGYNSSYGNTVIVRHEANGQVFYTLYAHMNAPGLPRGAEVRAGTVIGQVGSTGLRQRGPHLHFEIIRDDPNRRPHNTDGGAIGILASETVDLREDPLTFSGWPDSGVYIPPPPLPRPRPTEVELGERVPLPRPRPPEAGEGGPANFDQRFGPFGNQPTVPSQPVDPQREVPATLGDPLAPFESGRHLPRMLEKGFDPFGPQPGGSNPLGKGFDLFDPRPGAPLLQPMHPDNRTEYEIGGDRFASISTPDTGNSTPQQPDIAQHPGLRRLAEALVRNYMAPPSLTLQPPESAGSPPQPLVDDHANDPAGQSEKQGSAPGNGFAAGPSFPLTAPAFTRGPMLDPTSARIVNRVLAELDADDQGLRPPID